MRSMLLAVALLAAVASADVVSLYAKVNQWTGTIYDNQDTKIVYGSLASSSILTVNFDRDTKVLLTVLYNLTTPFPIGHNSLYVDAAGIGYRIEVSGSPAINKFVLQTPPMQLSNVTDFSMLSYDSSSQSYSSLLQTTYSSTKLTVSLPGPGTFFPVTRTDLSVIPYPYGSSFTLSGGAQRTYTFPNKIFAVSIWTQFDNTASVSYNTSSTRVAPAGMRGLGYWKIKLTSGGKLMATLQYDYSKEVKKVKNEETLSFAYYDSPTASWVFPTSGRSLNTTSNILTQTTTHFSEWAVFESSSASLVVSSLTVLCYVFVAFYNSL